MKTTDRLIILQAITDAPGSQESNTGLRVKQDHVPYTTLQGFCQVLKTLHSAVPALNSSASYPPYPGNSPEDPNNFNSAGQQPLCP